jgi:hypothetical protein
MENEILSSSIEGTYLPPARLVEMSWWGLSCVLIVSVGISVILSVIKEVIRSFRKLPDTIETNLLRLIGIVIGSLLIGFADFYPFEIMPVMLRVFLGMIAGAHSELVYRWFLKAIEAWVKKKVRTLAYHEDN